MPAVSVIMAFHRVTPFLRPAVRSILDQTLRDLELILIDNGTGAGLAALGEEGRDPRVRLIPHATNLGVAAAHNLGRDFSTGAYLANMDSDDLALPTRLERQLEALREDPHLSLLSTHATMIDEAGRALRPQFTLARHEEQRVFSAYSLPVTNPTLMGPRRVFDEYPMRAAFAISSDYDFFARVVEEQPCRTLPEVLLHYRRHGGQVTVSENPSMVFHACLIRLLTARRRAGRPEDLDALLRDCGDWVREAPPPAESYARFARRALAEGFPLLGVFLARRVVSVRRDAPALLAALRLLGGALWRDPRDAVRLLRMFATGPLRTHRLRPL